MTIRALCLSALLALFGTLRADEVRLHDGRVLIGTVKAVGDQLRVTTRDGVVEVSASEVQRIRTDDELRAELARLADRAGDGSHGCIELARLARDYGLADEMWAWLDRAIASKPAPKLRARLETLLASLEPELLGDLKPGNARGRVRFLMIAARSNGQPARREAVARVLAGTQDESAWSFVQRTARNSTVEADRAISLRALAMRGDTADERTVWRATVVDPSPAVRGAAIAIARTSSKPEDVVGFLAPALVHDSVEVRLKAVEALAGLRHPSAIAPIAAAGPTAALAAVSPGSTRGYIAFLEQQAYIRDFEVEVAQAAFIADPKIDVLQSGTVLDVTVAAVISERVITTFRRSLTTLAGADPGGDPASWSAWAAALEASRNESRDAR